MTLCWKDVRMKCRLNMQSSGELGRGELIYTLVEENTSQLPMPKVVGCNV